MMNKFNPLINRKLSKEEQKERIEVKCSFCINKKTISKLAYRKNMEKNNYQYKCMSCGQKGKIIPKEQREKIRATLLGNSYEKTKKINSPIIPYNSKIKLKDIDKVSIRCDECNKKKNISYRDATINVNRNKGNFICRKCSLKSNKMSKYL